MVNSTKNKYNKRIPLSSNPNNIRQPCPICNAAIGMYFVWPSPQKNPQVEALIGRFQRCTHCGWMGDTQTLIRFNIQPGKGFFWVDDHIFETPEQFLKHLGWIS